MANTPEAEQLQATIELWHGIQDKLQPSVNVSGGTIETASIGESMERIADMVEQSGTGNVDPIAKTVQWPNIGSQINNLRNYIQQIVNNGAAHNVFQSQAQNIVNTIWSLRTAIVWLLPYSDANSNIEERPRLKELVASADSVLDLRRRAGEASRELQNILDAQRQQAEHAKALMTEIEGSERTAANARSNAEASSSATKQSVDMLETLLKDDSERSKILQGLLEEFNRKKVLVDETLEGASKVALANSFQVRRKSLAKERWWWVVGFVIGIVLLVVISALVVPKLLSAANLSGPTKYVEMLGHVLILAPLVWATWFAARKAGQTMRLAEDYAFKEAAAHSFVGYKREMGDDAEMLHQLRQYAIRNFGADPLRVLEEDEAASPLHAVIDKLLDRVDRLKPDEAMKAFSELAKVLGQFGTGK